MSLCEYSFTRSLQFLFAFAAWLILLGWYDSVEICFLPVGHTKNQNDALLKEIARVSSSSTKTLFHLLRKLSSSTPKPYQFVVIDGRQDWRSFFLPVMPGVEGHFSARDFLIERDNQTGWLVCRAKASVAHSDRWGNPVRVLIKSPEGLPLPLSPAFNPVFPSVRAGLESFMSSHSLSTNEKKWYESVLETKHIGIQVVREKESGEGARLAGVIGESGLLWLGSDFLSISVIRGGFPAPFSIPPQLFGASATSLNSAKEGGAVVLKNAPKALLRFRSSSSGEEDDGESEREEEEQEVTKKEPKSDEEKDKSNVIDPEKNYRVVDLRSTDPPPKHSFVVLRGLAGVGSRPWQLAQLLEPKANCEEEWLVRYWGTPDTSANMITTGYLPAFHRWTGREWQDVYGTSNPGKPSVGEIDRDQIMLCYEASSSPCHPS